MISQLSIFLENESGRLAAATRAISNNLAQKQLLAFALCRGFILKSISD